MEIAYSAFLFWKSLFLCSWLAKLELEYIIEGTQEKRVDLTDSKVIFSYEPFFKQP